MEYAVVILVGYLIGTLNPALVTAKVVSGIDIREVNSKNPGTSNIAITLGLKYAVLVGILDILKGLIPVLVLRILYPDTDYMWFIGGISVTLGHIYPFYMKFKGGKGTATFGGVAIAAAPLLSLGVLIIFIVVTFWSDFIAVSTIVGFTLIALGIYILDFHYISVTISTLFLFLSIYKHWPNVVRIYNKTEIGLKEAFAKD